MPLKNVLKILKSVLIVVILTILTQVGGLVYLVYKALARPVRRRVTHRWKQLGLRAGLFVGLWLVFSLLIVPPLARLGGRVPLPLRTGADHAIRPANILTCLANRHYVRPELKEALKQVSGGIGKRSPGTEIIYLDAGFPFWNGFPLLPHLSHDDGRKVDICFLYRDPRTGKRVNRSPSFLGYGFSEGPRPGEHDQPGVCREKGYWIYSFVRGLTPHRRKERHFAFDEPANAALLRLITAQPALRTVFIEPHLKTRLGLQHDPRIRYHGCQAVRHDDHIHIQL